MKTIEKIKENSYNLELALNDSRSVTTEQRKKVFALIKDIANWSGYEATYLRYMMIDEFCLLNDIEHFSLSNVDITTIINFIDYLITFCLHHNIPCLDTLLNRCEDINKYLYACLFYRRCCVCGKTAEVHHIDTVGMGNNRKTTNHVGKRAAALCHIHHQELHNIGDARFLNKYHIAGIELTQPLIKKLKI